MDPITMTALMGGMNMLQNAQMKKQETQDRILAAQTQRYSPWTKMEAQAPERQAAAPLSAAFQGGLAGYAQSQNAQRAEQDQVMQGEFLKNLQLRNQRLQDPNYRPYSTVGNGSSVNNID